MTPERTAAAALARQSTRYTYGFDAAIQAFTVNAPAVDGGRVVATYAAGNDRERAHDNAAALCDRYNKGITPRQLALI